MGEIASSRPDSSRIRLAVEAHALRVHVEELLLRHSTPLNPSELNRLIMRLNAAPPASSTKRARRALRQDGSTLSRMDRCVPSS